MSSVSSVSNEQSASRSSKPRGPYTARGQSCSNCRRRKIKCDGKRPTCSPCMRSSGPTEQMVCEYTATNRSEIQALEANIKVLQNRIRELEVVQETDDAGVTLYQPYAASSAPAPLSEGEFHTGVSGGQLQEIDENMTQPFLDIFLRYSTELGFFLHIPRFRHSMSLPKGSPERPSEGLISTVYLLGFHLSGLNVGDAQQREQAYLSRALLDVANILSSPHRDRTVHAIQAEILLAGHFFSTGRILEGKYHLHAALSITIAAKLHKIRSQNTDPGFPGMSSSDIFGNISQLDVPLDQIAEGERINAFWTTFTMSNCWAVAADSPQNFLVESFGPTVDTPWPLDMGGYEQGLLPFKILGRETVTRFLEQHSTFTLGDNSFISMYAKSSILLVRAATLSAIYRTDMWQQRAEIFSVQFTALDNLLSSFNSSLIPLSQNAHSSEYFSFAFVTHLTTKVAIITLHSKLRDISSESAEKVLSAAEACTDMIAGNISSDSTAHANPLLPSLWMTIGQVLIEELRRLRSEHQFRGVARAPGREEAIDVKLQQVLTTMRHTPAHSPLNDYMFSKLQEAYRNL
ncbi:hypothetical protein C8R41DRAFT_372633 [Lentinula lateritia]|uniref:Zn(2)-C6 fungal-type domain-containing protein n=1 Tax=Lentinula lateritia TaxID=40482 RepID=A0ABQ8VFZ3_9AGAR|nr:hypothetical protein C8R41DRAFT_372633 [Lentinula lateritia]